MKFATPTAYINLLLYYIYVSSEAHNRFRITRKQTYGHLGNMCASKGKMCARALMTTPSSSSDGEGWAFALAQFRRPKVSCRAEKSDLQSAVRVLNALQSDTTAD